MIAGEVPQLVRHHRAEALGAQDQQEWQSERQRVPRPAQDAEAGNLRKPRVELPREHDAMDRRGL